MTQTDAKKLMESIMERERRRPPMVQHTTERDLGSFDFHEFHGLYLSGETFKYKEKPCRVTGVEVCINKDRAYAQFTITELPQLFRADGPKV